MISVILLILFHQRIPASLREPLQSAEREGSSYYAFPVTGGKQPLGGSTRSKAIAKKALKPVELALWPKSTEWGNHPLYDYGYITY